MPCWPDSGHVLRVTRMPAADSSIAGQPTASVLARAIRSTLVLHIPFHREDVMPGILTAKAVAEIRKAIDEQSAHQALVLRVDGTRGGCSGFEYQGRLPMMGRWPCRHLSFTRPQAALRLVPAQDRSLQVVELRQRIADVPVLNNPYLQQSASSVAQASLRILRARRQVVRSGDC
jgi:hypothetical protein